MRGYPRPVAWIGVQLDALDHRERIRTRAFRQFDGGLIEEAKELRRRFDPALPAFTAIGYAEAWAVLDGRQTREVAIEADIARNIAFAKRQRTWFRSEPDIAWVPAQMTAPEILRRADVAAVVRG